MIKRTSPTGPTVKPKRPRPLGDRPCNQIRRVPSGWCATPNVPHSLRATDRIHKQPHRARFPRGPALAESDDPLYSSSAAAARDVDGRAPDGGGAGLAPGLSLGFVNADDDEIGISLTATDTPGICSEPYYG